MKTRSDDGESLIEVLLAVTILGLAFVALLGGLATGILGSDIHRKQSDAGVVLRAAAEELEAATLVTCAGQTSYATTLNAVPKPPGWSSPTLTSVQYWDGSSFGTTCYDTFSSGVLQAQRLALQVTSPDGRDTENLVLVKRPS